MNQNTKKYSNGIKVLTQRLSKEGIKVEYVKTKTTRDFVGMNPYAAKAMGYKMPKNVVKIDKQLSVGGRYHTLKHEYDEMHSMKKGMKYWPAHVKALRSEKVVVGR